MDVIIINNKLFKQIRINTNYFISQDGEIYSQYAKRIIKTPINITRNKKYKRVDININGKQKHIPVHRLVYDTWIEKISSGEQINHKNDNSLDNRMENLYKGSQKNNIRDCIANQNRIGHIKYLTIYDKQVEKTITFIPSSKFIEYSGHPCKNQSVQRMFNKRWFKNRYEIINFGQIQNRLHLQSVTTMADECKPVDRILSPVEAHGHQ